jgi:hypothetical protein
MWGFKLHLLSLILLLKVSEVFPQQSPISPVNLMLADIGTEPKIIYKQRFLGSRLHFRNKTLHFRCPALFTQSPDQLNLIWPPLPNIPLNLTGSYTFDGLIPIYHWHFEEKQNAGQGYDWPKQFIESYTPHRSRMFCYLW